MSLVRVLVDLTMAHTPRAVASPPLATIVAGSGGCMQSPSLLIRQSFHLHDTPVCPAQARATLVTTACVLIIMHTRTGACSDYWGRYPSSLTR